MFVPHDYDLDQLLAHFDSGTLSRGLGYARQGRVRDPRWSDDGLGLTGRCLGSGHHVYVVSARFEHAPHGLELTWVDCSCPIGAFCKHAVALLIAVDSDEPPPDTDRWRTVITKVVDELTPPGTSAAPIGLECSIAPPTRYRRSAVIALRPVTLGKRGTWIKTGLDWPRLMYRRHPGEFDGCQFAAVSALANELSRSGLVPIGDALTTAGVSPAFWSRLDEAVTAGVTIVAGSGLRAVEFIDDARLRFEFTSDGAGGAMMSAVVMLDGTARDADDVGLIGSPAAHGVFEIVDGVLRLGPFDPVPGRTSLELATRADRVHIPAETVAEFSLDLLPRLLDVAEVEHEAELFTPPTISGPMPVLTVKLTHAGVRAHWSVRYLVNDTRHHFDPESDPRRTGYRDAAAEQLAWDRVIPALQTVAASSHTWKKQAVQHLSRRVHGSVEHAPRAELQAVSESGDTADAVAVASLATLRSATDLTMAEAAVLCGELLPGLPCRDAFAVELDATVPQFRVSESGPLLEFSAGDGEPVRNDWFDLGIVVQIDGHRVPIAAVIAELAAGATHMLMPDGVYFRLDTPELLRLRELIEEGRALGEIEGDRVNAGTRNVTLWDELLALGVVDKQLAGWQERMTHQAAVAAPVRVDVPEGLAATLRDYQREGLDWLSFLWDNQIGGVLADDMGLGKTVQTLALIARASERGARRFLVVAPTSVVTNWTAECRKFTPGLTSVAVTSTETRMGTSLAERAAEADIVVTSYALLRIDVDAYAGIDWAGVILDEAQFVKNHTSKTHQCVRRLGVPFTLAITGTPLENNLMELWALLSLTVPGLFPSAKAFTNYFRKPIESGSNRARLPVLRRRIKPVMLRRTKGQVASELPPKQEQVLSLDLGAKHRKLYDVHMAKERQRVLGLLGEWEQNRFQVFRSLTLLRQLSLHAGLVDQTKLDVGSAKVDFLVEQLPELVAEGHSALVFSQFTGFLDVVRTHLDAIGTGYAYLDGSMNRHQRDEAVRRFTSGVDKVFLISLKAGGFGLNLTEADYCFVCDPWWNPAAEAQAIDRTHRIGQTRPVTVYRLVAAGTIEEKVVALQERKRGLFTAVVDENELFGSAITASDVRELFG